MVDWPGHFQLLREDLRDSVVSAPGPFVPGRKLRGPLVREDFPSISGCRWQKSMPSRTRLLNSQEIAFGKSLSSVAKLTKPTAVRLSFGIFKYVTFRVIRPFWWANQKNLKTENFGNRPFRAGSTQEMAAFVDFHLAKTRFCRVCLLPSIPKIKLPSHCYEYVV